MPSQSETRDRTSLHWARLKVDGGYGLRRGAWYTVGALTGEEALIRVRGQWVHVPWAVLEVTGTPPSRWTVVPRPANVVMLPETWGPHYGVCPRCHYRASLEGAPQEMRCPRCSGLFGVAWDEEYLGRVKSAAGEDKRS